MSVGLAPGHNTHGHTITGISMLHILHTGICTVGSLYQMIPKGGTRVAFCVRTMHALVLRWR